MTQREIIAGFMPLLDCAVLAVAAEGGFARQEGVTLTLVKESSWANIRDRLIVGHFHAAHLLGPMAVASTLGLAHLRVPMIAPIALGLGGNAITLSPEIWLEMQRHGAAGGASPAVQGAALAACVRERARSGAAPLTLAMVYPFSCHNYELRYWLAAAGIDPDSDVQLVVLPPPLLVEALRERQIDGFCSGEPWSSLGVDAGVGCIVTATSDIWRRSPEKVLGMRTDWADSHPEEVAALVRACYRAAAWCAAPGNRTELATLLAKRAFIDAPGEVLERGLSGNLVTAAGKPAHQFSEFLQFQPHAATLPRKCHALWFYAQMVRWGQAAASPAAALAAQGVYRADLYRTAVAPVSGAIPEDDAGDVSEDFFDHRGS